MNGLFDNIYKVIVSPDKGFEKIKGEDSLSFALVIIVFLTIFMHILRFEHSGSISNFGACLFTMQFSVIFGIFIWFITGLFFELLAKPFDKSGNLKTYLSLSAYALVPSIFFAPASAIKALGSAGYFLGVIGELSIYVWVVYLSLKAIRIAYNLKFSRVFFLIAVPFVSWIMLIIWMIGFFADMNYIFNS